MEHAFFLPSNWSRDAISSIQPNFANIGSYGS